MTDDRRDRDGGRVDGAERRRTVRERYAEFAADAPSCCESDAGALAGSSGNLGYTDDDLDAAPAGADLGLGCGNPTGIASLDPGDTVVDLGSGGGFDCFLAAREVGESGRVIGVDMTPEMVERARENAASNDASVVEFRLGEIEHLPVADGVADAVLSNCAINLSADKPRVFREAFRVLRPGGRLVASDVVATGPLPDDIRTDPAAVAACLGGATAVPRLESMLVDAGFVDVRVEPASDDPAFLDGWGGDDSPADRLAAATIEARKPTAGDDPGGGTGPA